MSAMFELARPDDPTREASSKLQRGVDELRDSRAQHSASLAIEVDGRCVHYELPPAVLDVLLHTAREQAEGHRVRIIAPDATSELTPNEAAAYLGISRPLLVKLLDAGTIPARNKPGSSHRMISVADLDAYAERKSARQNRLAAAMDDIAEQDLYLP
ncbi:helix-turn-helix domain-containing protein [Saccharopolyspora sp. 6T]|uniref:helix-turn-helix domain-containing protein n=1 Tax=Saccharopolyspora sp. 6T TaxID=2877238 RepID=UPI001CD3F215|nr:helix-turn-helix domain-containing protein [Saccharopolyspora sp. 6T]MCA1188365.1 helix-turn-helix domain-containing protein [Saccharopolyspora sp. 6T]